MDEDNPRMSSISGPTLGLVGGGTSSVRNSQPASDKNEKGPCLVSVSSMNSDKGKELEKDAAAEKPKEGVHDSGSESEPTKRPRLTTTLLIFKKPSDESEDYVIANATPSQSQDDDMEEEDEDHHHKKKKKKKKKKSKERTLSMPRSYAQELLEMQKSMSKITNKYQTSPFEEIDRRRRIQSSSFIPISDTLSALKSPPLSAPVQPHTPFFPGSKGKSLYRRRQLSLGSNTESKRRLGTRRKRWESGEKVSGITTPTFESVKKSHLSENNVWTPMDDYRLLINITQTKGNLEHVFAGTKFSCFYTFEDVAQRWESLLYDEKAGILSQTAINNLHPLVKAKIQSEALFSDEEENLLRTIKTVPGGTPELSSFIKLLEENPHVFYHRTARKLLLHWLDLKNFHLLEGQDVRDYKDPFNLFEFQDNAYLATVPDLSVYQELKTESKLVKRQIRKVEEELESWHCMQELVLSDGTDLHSIFSISEFDDQTYAILRGKQVRYCMRSKEILLGRHSTNNKVDADLTLEGASGKVSRRQAVIQMREFGEFFIINQGQHSIFVDNMHVPYGAMAKLSDGCVIQITDIKLIFKINDKLLRNEISNEIKKEVINVRYNYKTLDSISSTPPYSPVSGLKPTGSLGPDLFPMPSTSRYTSPNTKRRSTSSASNSPILGLSGSFTSPNAGRPGSSRSAGSPVGLNNFGNPLMPLSATGDLTIRPTSQPSVSSPFITDMKSKSKSKSFISGHPASDNDVFKKPAPVSFIRFPSGKIPNLRMSSPSSTAASASSSVPSAFAAVPGLSSPLQFQPNNSATGMSQDRSHSHTETSHVTTNSSSGGVSTTLPMPPVGQLMDSSKLGLSSDVTVTQRTTQPMETDQPSTSENSSLEPSSNLNNSTASSGTEEPKTISTPTLGLVRVEQDPR